MASKNSQHQHHNQQQEQRTLESLLKCALCNVDLDDDNRPKSLPCLHIFCSPCMTNKPRCFIRDNNILQCPECHTSMGQSSEGLEIFDNLKLDVITEKLLHARRIQQRVPAPCGNGACTKGGALSTHWCQDCGIFLCDLCSVYHKEYKPKDQVIDVSQGVDNVSDFISSTKCLRHKKKYKIYCSQCDICLCSVCSSEHRSNGNANCVLVSIEAMVPDTKSQGRQLLQETTSHLVKEKQQIEGMKLKIGDLKRQYAEEGGKIWEHLEETISRLKESARKLIAELETNNKIVEFEKFIQLRQNHIKKIKIATEHFRQLLNLFQNVDLLLNYSRMESKCKHLLMEQNDSVPSALNLFKTEYNTWYLETHRRSENESVGRCIKNTELSDPFSLDESSGTKMSENETLLARSRDFNLSDNSSLDKISCSKEVLHKPRPFLQPPPVPFLEHSKYGNFPIDYSNVYGMFVTDPNHVLVHSGSRFILYNYNTKSESSELHYFKPSTINTDLCRLGDTFYYVDNRLFLIQENKDTSSINIIKEIKPPVKYYSICNCFGRILVCDVDCRVYILTEKGTVFKTILDIKKGGSYSHKIRCGPFENTFLLFDSRDKKLHCYSLSDRKCLFLLKVGPILDLCTDKYGNIYVAEQDEVYVLSPDSLEKHHFLTTKSGRGKKHIFVKDDVFYFASKYSRKWMLEKFQLHYRQRSD